MEAEEKPLALIPRGPLMTVVGVVSAEWRSQKQNQREP